MSLSTTLCTSFDCRLLKTQDQIRRASQWLRQSEMNVTGCKHSVAPIEVFHVWEVAILHSTEEYSQYNSIPTAEAPPIT